jgi:hypothetical protein
VQPKQYFVFSNIAISLIFFLRVVVKMRRFNWCRMKKARKERELVAGWEAGAIY